MDEVSVLGGSLDGSDLLLQPVLQGALGLVGSVYCRWTNGLHQVLALLMGLIPVSRSLVMPICCSPSRSIK